MQLNIYELNENDAEDTENNELIEPLFEEIPENTISIKKNVPQSILKKNVPQSILKKNVNKPKISYEDILSKMGMFVSDGKLHLVDKNSVSFKNDAEGKENKVITNIPQNSYIHNKYFKNELQAQNTIAPAPPKTLQEYKKRVLENYIERLRINQIKSKKLLMPTSNISMATGNSSNLNKFFKFK
jgi:hypothetical protein